MTPAESALRAEHNALLAVCRGLPMDVANHTTAIHGFADLLVNHPTLDQTAREYAEEIVRSVKGIPPLMRGLGVALRACGTVEDSADEPVIRGS